MNGTIKVDNEADAINAEYKSISSIPCMNSNLATIKLVLNRTHIPVATIILSFNDNFLNGSIAMNFEPLETINMMRVKMG